ncbi:MAG: hypothetical protein ACOYVF_03940 [Candidatus Zixiibacteriota bacterium]
MNKRQLLSFLIVFFVCLGGGDAFGNRLKKGDKQNTNGTNYDGLIIDSIVIENRNIYNTRDKRYNNFFFKTANKLHFVTRPVIIRRELLFNVGDPYSSDLAEEIGRNLRAQYVLYDAWVEPELLPNGYLLVKVITIDQWSLLGGLTIRREGNETNYQIGFEERNFLGYNQLVTADYFILENDDNYFQAGFIDRRLGGKPFYLSLDYSDEPVNTFRKVIFAKPFYNLNQQFSFSLTYNNRGSRRDVYWDTYKVAQSRNEGDVFSLFLKYRWGEYKRKIGLSFYYDYTYEKTYERLLFNPDLEVDFPVDTVYHMFTIGLPLENLDFAKLKRIDGFTYTEDVTLGETIEFTAARAFNPDFKGHVYDEVGFSGAMATYFNSNLLSIGYRRFIKYKEGQDLRHQSNLTLKYYNNHLSFFTLAFRAAYVSDWRIEGTSDLVLGGVNALRGYNKYFKTGNRINVINLEGRFYPNIELLSVMLGGVVFTDWGQAWKAGEPLHVRDYYWDVGIGLRVSFEKATKNKIIRIDLAFNENNNWELSIETGQFF